MGEKQFSFYSVHNLMEWPNKTNLLRVCVETHSTLFSRVPTQIYRDFQKLKIQAFSKRTFEVVLMWKQMSTTSFLFNLVYFVPLGKKNYLVVFMSILFVNLINVLFIYT